MKSRYEGLQNRLLGIGEGCFFIALLSIAEEYRLEHGKGKVDFVDAVNMAFERQWITSDYTVKKDTALLKWLTGTYVSKRESKTCGELKDNEYSIAKYLNREGTANHFDRRYFNVYTNSKTIKYGTLLCYYIYTIGD